MSCWPVIVIGGGPSGCAAAVACRTGGLSTLLLHRPNAGKYWSGESLPPGGQQLMEGVFGSGILTEGNDLQSHGNCGTWGSETFFENEFLWNPLGTGWFLDRPVFDAAARRAAQESGVTVVEDGFVEAERLEDRWRLRCDSGIHEAAWVVDASGRQGVFVRALGIPARSMDRQVALVAKAAGCPPSGQQTLIESTPLGWWYTCPLSRGERVVAFLTDRDLVPSTAQRADWWWEGLRRTTHIRAFAEGFPRPERIPVFPAGTQYRERLHGRGWCAVGDAAIAWDPLSSQGLVTGVLMGSRAGSGLARGPGSLAGWEQDCRLLLAEHLSLRSYYWSQERRWVDETFWRRRSSEGDPVGLAPEENPGIPEEEPLAPGFGVDTPPGGG